MNMEKGCIVILFDGYFAGGTSLFFYRHQEKEAIYGLFLLVTSAGVEPALSG